MTPDPGHSHTLNSGRALAPLEIPHQPHHQELCPSHNRNTLGISLTLAQPLTPSPALVMIISVPTELNSSQLLVLQAQADSGVNEGPLGLKRVAAQCPGMGVVGVEVGEQPESGSSLNPRERKQSSLGVSRSWRWRRMRGWKLRATAPTPIPTPSSILCSLRVAVALCQAGRKLESAPGWGAQGGSQSPGRGTTLVGGTWSSPVWPRDTLPTVPQC